MTNQNTVFNTRHKKFSYSKINQSKHCIHHETRRFQNQYAEEIKKNQSINQSTVFKRHVDFRISMLSKLKKIDQSQHCFQHETQDFRISMLRKFKNQPIKTLHSTRDTDFRISKLRNLKFNQSQHCIHHDTQISEFNMLMKFPL